MSEVTANGTAAAGAKAQGAAIEFNDFERLLSENFKPKTEETQTAIVNAVKSMAEIAVSEASLISDNTMETLEGLIAAIDKKIEEQMNMVIHHPDFRELEGSWRGLQHLVSSTETDETLKIRVFDASKEELATMFKKYKGTAWDQSPLFKKVYEEEFGTAGGAPFGCIVGDYSFSHRAPDIAWLEGMGKVAASAHVPFITAANPDLFNMSTWQELSNPRDLTKLTGTVEYASWVSLRKNEDMKYIGLTMPRTLSRLPYSKRDNPIEEFAFEEDVAGAPDDKFVWSNAAYAMGVNITRAFKEYGWCTAIRGVENGGTVDGLPNYTFKTDDGGVAQRCPTEIAITDRREAELSKLGLLPLIHWKNTDYAVFLGAQSMYEPQKYEDPDATANANLSARLPYMFAMCRFAHYLKCIVRDKIGSFTTKSEIEAFLNRWISRYVVANESASQHIKARFPLAAAEVKVEEDLSNPGYYKSTFYLKPHYQLEGLTVSLRLVSKLPSQKGG